MAKNNDYNCIIYDIGDEVIEKHGDGEILEIEATRIGQVGIFQCQFLRFKGKKDDIGCFSNLYIPAGKSIEKYKDGVKTLDSVKVKLKLASKASTIVGAKFHTMMEKKLKKDNTLTAEDLKPTITHHSMFNGRPPLIKE